MKRRKIVIIGGGASGFFAAINAAKLAFDGSTKSKGIDPSITLLEGTRRVLTKVKISGGGRCNTTHACFNPRELVKNYPRGGKELLGAFSRFGPTELVDWFALRGISLKTEADGRMFPESNSSQTIIDCLRKEAIDVGVELRTGAPVQKIERLNDGFRISWQAGQSMECTVLLLCTGSAPGGHQISKSLGHEIIKPVPSLFTFKISDPRLTGLQGVAFEKVKLELRGGNGLSNNDSRDDGNLPKLKFAKRQTPLKFLGPMLITHWGLSGPGVLKLSAWGARDLFDCDYTARLMINFCPSQTFDGILDDLKSYRSNRPRQTLNGSNTLVSLPKRFWQQLLKQYGIGRSETWADQSNRTLEWIATELTQGEYLISGKGVFKEEFVTCGGVKLAEVDFRTMESKICSGLFFAGEILDIDGITGGFNFQNAWTTGWIAAGGMQAKWS